MMCACVPPDDSLFSPVYALLFGWIDFQLDFNVCVCVLFVFSLVMYS